MPTKQMPAKMTRTSPTKTTTPTKTASRSRKAEQADQTCAGVPSTITRSDGLAVRTWKKAHDSAVGTYGEGQRAHRAAYAALKHTHEKVGDHWRPKSSPGPSDARAKQSAPASVRRPRPTAEGVNATAPLTRLREMARELEIPGRTRMTRDELISAIKKANRRATAAARR
ncbi:MULTISPECIES: ChaB family protein [Pseudofrankia]|uniref:ChaB family protein n=1 Tax=Pseudofrankia TaxID=2994363 RepID=UPI000234DB69|nr:ChaB family protein [Pseudofrankia sp. EUN1h]